jgi:UDP-N-acetylglucosamine 1-carboxyvinyltransferase
VLAKGTTVLKNCACEPEIVNVAEWLTDSGAEIVGAGTSTITITGRSGKLLSARKPFVTIPDRITTGSFLILGALCAKELTITQCRPDHVESVIALLKSAGADITVGADSIVVRNDSRPVQYSSVARIQTLEYPGFPTDLQSPMVVFLTQCTGQTTVVETIFEGRFKYVEDVLKLGAQITTVNPHEIVVKGPTPFKELPDGTELTAHDIRAGFAIVLAALIGKGKSVVNNVHLIDRGYEQLEEVLRKLGARVERVKG